MKKLLFLHGALGSSAHWKNTVEHLKDDFDCLVVDFPGHGQAPAVQNLQIKDLVLFLKNFLNEHPDVIGIVGYSMGAYVAINLLEKEPQLNCSLMALAVKLDWSPEIAEKECGNLTEDKLHPILDKLRALHGHNYDRLLVNTASVLRSIGIHPIDTGRFRKIKQAVTFVLGENDKMVTREETILFAESNPNAKLLVIDGQGHLLEKIDPILLSETIKNTFRDHVAQK